MPTFFVCHGSDCRKRRKEFNAVVESLAEEGRVCPVKCQKICKGPVVGMNIEGRIEWFSKLRTKQSRQHLIAFIRQGELSKRLWDRVKKKRRGKLRGKTPLQLQPQAL